MSRSWVSRRPRSTAPCVGRCGRGTADESKGYYIDALAVDSAYDYDPFWQSLVELGVAPMTHTGAMGWPDRASISNFSYNHLGHFAQHAARLRPGLFFGRGGQTVPVAAGRLLGVRRRAWAGA